MMTLALLFLFCALIVLRVPVAMSMLLASLLVLVAIGGVPLLVMPQFLIAGLTKFELLAIPFFILAAEIMNAGGMTSRVFRLALVFVGWIRGGLAQVNVAASVIFAGISGTAVADAAGLGRVEVRAMHKAGYNLAFACAITLASCVIGPLIPPSVVLVIYAVIAEVSVGEMLLAGVGPGLLLALLLMAFIYALARRDPSLCPLPPRPDAREVRAALAGGIPALGAPFIILAGIVGGVVTPTEAGVAASAYCLLVSLVVYRELNRHRLVTVFRRATLSSATVLFIIAAATVMSWIITREQSANVVIAWMAHLSDAPWLQLLMINVFLLVIGCLIEGVPALLVLTPLLLPVTGALGIDPVHFGVIMILNIVIGILTPPMGVGLFIMANITGLPAEQIMRACVPFLLPLLLTLLIVTYVPAISLWLPTELLR